MRAPFRTRSGRLVDLRAPRAADMHLPDIAGALSKMCRYNGHVARFYSVAEHSVLLSRHLSRVTGSLDHARWALLHDASEAYTPDVTAPLKRTLGEWEAIEAPFLIAIAAAFGLSLPMPALVHLADVRIVADETAALFARDRRRGRDPLGVAIQAWGPEEAERRFLERAAELGL